MGRQCWKTAGSDVGAVRGVLESDSCVLERDVSARLRRRMRRVGCGEKIDLPKDSGCADHDGFTYAGGRGICRCRWNESRK